MHSLTQQLVQTWPPSAWADVSVLVAVSGGPDSVALLRALVELKAPGPGRLHVAHFNHRLRGAASDADAAFVERLAGDLGLSCAIGDAAPVVPAGEGLEGGLRTQRYAFLEQTAAKLGARFVATGHTAEDQVETILHRILRGTGVAGLRGIARARRLGPDLSLVRPLLDVSRTNVIDYLQRLNQPFRRDASNDEPTFTRNRLRHELLPLLAQVYNPHIGAALLRLAEQAGEVHELIESELAALQRHAVRVIRPDHVEVSPPPDLAGYLLRALVQRVWTLQGWPLQDMNAAKWHELADLLSDNRPPPTRTATKRSFPGGVSAEKQGGKLVLSRPG